MVSKFRYFWLCVFSGVVATTLIIAFKHIEFTGCITEDDTKTNSNPSTVCFTRPDLLSLFILESLSYADGIEL